MLRDSLLVTGRLTGSLLPLVEAYAEHFSEEACRLTSLFEFLRNHRCIADQIRRDNFDGHLTVSGLIIDPSYERVLLIEHRALKKRLQPGGHVEESDGTLIAAAYREIEEETGLSARDLQMIAHPQCPALPIDINSHTIPARVAKGEAEHVHHDLRYLFVNKSKCSSSWRSPEDNSPVGWAAFEEAFADAIQQHLAAKIRRWLAVY